MKRLISGAVLLSFLAACQGVGPSTRAIVENPNAVKLEAEAQEKFLLVDVNRAVADKAAASKPQELTTNFLPQGAAGPINIGSGDVLDIAIVSTNANGFIDFTQSSVSPVSSTSLPPQTVGTDGMVNVPPLGRVRASGQSVQQFERFLSRRLAEILVDPSVIVTLTERNSAQVSVVGDVNAPGRYAINQTSKHLVDVISAAGGPTARPEELTVTVNRRGTSASISADRLLANPQYNIHLQPNDVVTVRAERRTFTVLGAATQNQTQEFATRDLTVAQALGSSGGLSRQRAERSGVFLFRELSPEMAAAMGADTSLFTGTVVPAIFQFDLEEPTSLFHAAKFPIQDGDILYISDSPNEEVNAAIGAITNFVPAPVEYVRAETITN